MPGLSSEESVAPAKPKGVLRTGWSARTEDYPIAGGWALGGDLLVVGDAAGGVYGFAGKSGELEWVARDVHQEGLLSLDVSPDGVTVATVGQDGRLVLLHAADGGVARAIDVGEGWVEHVSWAPSGERLAVSCSREVCVFDTQGAELWRSEAHPSTVSAIAWASDDELATACYGRVAFFAVGDGSLAQSLEWKGSLVSLVLSPDGDIVACGSQDNTVHFWRRSTGEDSMMSGYPSKPSALAFDESGTLLATNGGELVTVWSFDGNGPEGTSPGSLELHVRPVTALAFAHRGMRLASGGRDGAVTVWSVARDGQGDAIGVAILEDVVGSLLWRPDGRGLVALDAEGGVTAWRVRSK